VLLVYENRNTGVSAEWKKPVHVPPHLHEAIEVVYVTDGEIELGVGQGLKETVLVQGTGILPCFLFPQTPDNDVLHLETQLQNPLHPYGTIPVPLQVLILAHVFTTMPMMDKSAVGSDDLIYNAVEYVAK